MSNFTAGIPRLGRLQYLMLLHAAATILDNPPYRQALARQLFIDDPRQVYKAERAGAAVMERLRESR